MTRASLLLSLVLSVAGAHAEAQVVTMAETVEGPFRTNRTHEDLERLTAAYHSGEWETLQRLAGATIAAIAADATPDIKAALDLKRNHVALTWLGADAFGKTLLIRFVAHDPAPEPFSLDLPGLSDGSSRGALFELLLTRTLDGHATSAYASTREEDPLGDAFPGFIQSIAGPLFGALSAVAGAQAAATPRLFATVKRVGLPFERATVRITALARDPWFDAASFATGATEVAAQVRFRDVPTSPCGRDHARRVGAALLEPPAACAGQELGRCRTGLDDLLASLHREALSACDGGKPANAQIQALQLVDRRFREYVAASITGSAELQQTFHNRPPTRAAFGAGTAVMFGAQLTEPRVKLSGGALVADPVPRVMTVAFVNWSPRGYRPEAARVTFSERLRVQMGATLTPDFGVMLGGNLLLARGIGVTGGFAVLFAKGARQDEIGAAPADSTDPFRLSVITAPFAGITYNYK
jgi:hypothetical protein